MHIIQKQSTDTRRWELAVAGIFLGAMAQMITRNSIYLVASLMFAAAVILLIKPQKITSTLTIDEQGITWQKRPHKLKSFPWDSLQGLLLESEYQSKHSEFSLILNNHFVYTIPLYLDSQDAQALFDYCTQVMPKGMTFKRI